MYVHSQSRTPGNRMPARTCSRLYRRSRRPRPDGLTLAIIEIRDSLDVLKSEVLSPHMISRELTDPEMQPIIVFSGESQGSIALSHLGTG